jgi:hypothetical protein
MDKKCSTNPAIIKFTKTKYMNIKEKIYFPGQKKADISIFLV